MTIVFFLVLALVAFVIFWQGKKYQAFVDGAKVVTGQVVRKDVRLAQANKLSRTENWLLYSYTVNGKAYTGEERVEFAGLWGELTEGQELEIYYSEKNPGQSHPVSVIEKRMVFSRKLSGQTQ